MDPGGLRPVEIGIPPRRLARFADILPPERYEASLATLGRVAGMLRGRVVWHVSSTARGGGVAEMMGPLIGYARDAGVDTRWMVIEGSPEFFAITKRLHNSLHGDPGDGGELGAAERREYERVLHDNAVELTAIVRPGDVVVLHDPQTAALVPAMRRRGARTAWRCHIGHENLDDPLVARGWSFLEPYLRDADLTVFSRPAYVPACCARGRVEIITPSIDPFSPKNQDLSPEAVRSILVHAGLVEGVRDGDGAVFVRDDGAPGRVDRGADILHLGLPPRWDTPIVLQVSRWDRLKDPVGVMAGFAMLDETEAAGACLVLAGPAVTGVADDPEGPAVYAEVVRAWQDLPHRTRHRVQLATLPVVDVQENAAMVNALQRHAAVVVQKSLQEGFGLTVAEAMWKSRPVVAGAVGGIVDQIDDGRDGVLVDPTDPAAFADALRGLLADPERAQTMGEAGHARVRDHLLSIRHLADYARVLETVI